MSLASVLFLAVYLLLSAVYVAGVFAGKEEMIRNRIKPLLMPSLLVFYLSAAHPAEPLVIWALALGFLGDVLLMSSRLALLALGCVSFLGGHLCYAAVFAGRIMWSGFHPVMAVLAVYLVAAVLAVRKLWPAMDIGPGRGVCLISVLAYMAAIVTMSFLAVLYAALGGRPGGAVSAAGSLLFIVSDTVLAFGFFLKTSQKAVMPTYLAAQMMIVAGFLAG